MHQLTNKFVFFFFELAINQVGSTDAEYNVNTYSMISNELMRSSNRLLQHGQQLSAQLADYTYLLPVCLSLMIITVLLLMVCVIVKRNNQMSNASNSLLYGSIMGNRKEEQLQMANFSTLSTNKAKQMNCDGNLNCDSMGHLLITANGTMCESTMPLNSMPKLNNQNGQLENCTEHHTGLEPLYATVKRGNMNRTPRAIRNGTQTDSHIYSYPVQMNDNLTAMNTLNNTLNNLTNLNGLNNLNNLNAINSMSNGHLSTCNQYSNNYGQCNGNQCNLTNGLNCNQITMDANTCMMNQCNLDDTKLMNYSNNNEIYNQQTTNSSSCNTSLNSGQLMSNSLTTNGQCNGLNGKMICADKMTMETNNKFGLELNLCQMR